jgi:SAM-dependent methyltransferase
VAVTDDDVKWCFRSILAREPHSAEMVRRRAASAKDFRSLVLSFLTSKEYQAKKLHRPPVGPSNHKALKIEVRASEAELSQLKERVRNAWSHLGASQPYFSVLTHKDFLPDSMGSESVERFYSIGKREAAGIENTLKRFGLTNPRSKVCVEYGCGLGRVTIALARMFKVVHGYDISANHLALANERAVSAGISNVKFHLCSQDRIIENLESCDFLYSRIVFQHNPPPIISALIEASLKSLRVGGIAIFQVPTFGAGYSFGIKEYLAKPQRLIMEMHCIPQAEVFALIAAANCITLEVRTENVGRLGNWISNTFIVQRVARNDHVSRGNALRRKATPG